MMILMLLLFLLNGLLTKLSTHGLIFATYGLDIANGMSQDLCTVRFLWIQSVLGHGMSKFTNETILSSTLVWEKLLLLGNSTAYQHIPPATFDAIMRFSALFHSIQDDILIQR